MVIRSPRIRNYFDRLKIVTFINVHDLGKCFIRTSVFIVKKLNYSVDFPFMFLIIITPINSKTKSFKFVININDVREFNYEMSQEFLTQGFSYQLIIRFLTFVINNIKIQKQLLYHSVVFKKSFYNHIDYNNEDLVNLNDPEGKILKSSIKNSIVGTSNNSYV